MGGSHVSSAEPTARRRRETRLEEPLATDRATQRQDGGPIVSTAVNDKIVVHIPALRRYARRLTKNRSDSEDLVQNTLLRALGRWHLWRPEGGHLSQWLRTLCYHQFIDDVRRARRAPLVPLDDTDVRSLGTAPVDVVEIREVEDRIRSLQPHHRRLLLLAASGTTYPEIAALTHLPRGTVASRLSRARQLLAVATDR